MQNLKTARKILIAFALVVLACCGESAIVFTNLGAMDSATATAGRDADRLDLVGNAAETMLDASGVVRGFLLTRDPSFAATYEQDRASFRAQIDHLQASSEGPEILAGVKSMAEAGEGYFREAGDPEIRLGSEPATRDQALGIMTGGANKIWMNAFKTAAGAFKARATRSTTAARDLGQTTAQMTRVVLVAAGLLVVALASVLGWLLCRAIATPLGGMTATMGRLAGGDTGVEIPGVGRRDEIGAMAKAVQVFKVAAIERERMERDAAAALGLTESERRRNEAERTATAERQSAVVQGLAEGLGRLAAGDLGFRLHTVFDGDYEKLRTDFNAAMEQLESAMSAVAGSTATIRSGASEISSAAGDLSRRTEQQAASLEETAAALDEITATVKRTASGADHARSVVATARSDAERSGEVVRRAVGAMMAIETSAKQVSNIIGVIDEIAFQTNLLALNAGVEAARAGEAGRGFAVVASEVRGLAQRSAEAAKEIKALISTSTAQVGEGVALVSETGRALERIVGQIGDLHGVVAEIAASAKEQSTGLAEVNTAVNQMDQVTQQNAAMVEQSTAASGALASEAQELSRLISRFRTGGAAAQAERRPAPAPARAAPSNRLVTARKASAAAALPGGQSPSRPTGRTSDRAAQAVLGRG